MPPPPKRPPKAGPTPAQRNRQGMPDVQYEYDPVTGKWRIKRKGGNPPPRPSGPKPGGPKPLSPDQEAQRYIDTLIANAKEQQRIQIEEMERAYRERVARAQALAAAIQAQNFPGRIQGVYGAAGADIAGLAQGFAGGTRELAAADAAEQMNMLSGTGQEGAVREQGTNMGDVLYGVGGWIPGRSLGETGAAFAADAALQPAFTQQQGFADARKAYDETNASLSSEFAKMFAEIRMQKPELVQQFLDRRAKAQEDAFDRKIALQEQKRKDQAWALQMAEYYASRGDKKRAEYWRKRAYQLDVRKENRYDRAQRAAENARMGLNADGTKPLPGFKWADPADHSKGTVKIGDSKKGGLTANQKAEQYARVGKAEDDITKAIKDLISNGAWPGAGFVGPIPPPKRKQIENQLFAEFVQRLGLTTTKAKLALRQAIRRLLGSVKGSTSTEPGGDGDNSDDDNGL